MTTERDTITIEERSARLREHVDTIRRRRDLMDAWIVAIPQGTTRGDVLAALTQFAALVETSGPRKGLCRFGRDT